MKYKVGRLESDQSGLKLWDSPTVDLHCTAVGSLLALLSALLTPAWQRLQYHPAAWARGPCSLISQIIHVLNV